MGTYEKDIFVYPRIRTPLTRWLSLREEYELARTAYISTGDTEALRRMTEFVEEGEDFYDCLDEDPPSPAGPSLWPWPLAPVQAAWGALRHPIARIPVPVWCLLVVAVWPVMIASAVLGAPVAIGILLLCFQVLACVCAAKSISRKVGM